MAALQKRLEEGTDPPLFTVYFNRPIKGLDVQTFTVRLQFEVAIPREQGVARPGFYLELPLVGEILQAASAPGALTPHTRETYAVRSGLRAASGSAREPAAVGTSSCWPRPALAGTHQC